MGLASVTGGRGKRSSALDRSFSAADLAAAGAANKGFVAVAVAAIDDVDDGVDDFVASVADAAVFANNSDDPAHHHDDED